MNRSSTAWVRALVVFAKELRDALRDRRTLRSVLISAVAMGPVMLIVMSSLVASIESSSERRVVRISRMADAPTLVNFFQRQTWRVEEAPADFRERLPRSTLADSVVVVPADFEAALRRGDAPVIELVSAATNTRAQTHAGQVAQLLAAFGRERTVVGLALRGVAPDALEAVRVQRVDLAGREARGAQLTGMIPFVVLMAVLTGALNAALDTTAGERERGSLEPLLTNPIDRWVLVVGKWGAVAAVGMLVAVLSCLSFLPGQWLLRSDALAAMFQYGPREAALFLGVLLPFAAMASALLMAVAVRFKTFKEAQAGTTFVMLGASMLPLVAMFSFGEDKPWHLWVPALAQNVLMMRVLKGDPLGAAEFGPPLVVCAVVTVGAIAWIARTLRHAALR